MRQSGARHTLIVVALVHVGLLSAVVRGQADQSSTAANASLDDAQATQNADEIPAQYSIDDGPKEVLGHERQFPNVRPLQELGQSQTLKRGYFWEASADHGCAVFGWYGQGRKADAEAGHACRDGGNDIAAVCRGTKKMPTPPNDTVI